jgi:hypothetical protein
MLSIKGISPHINNYSSLFLLPNFGVILEINAKNVIAIIIKKA